MRQIRRNVFETNSSSSHSISLCSRTRVKNNMEISEYDPNYNGQNVLYVDLEGFCSDYTYTRQEEKLAYVFMQLASINDMYYDVIDGVEEVLEAFYETDDFITFESAVCEHIRECGQKCDIVRLRPGTSGYIDHESRFYNKYDAAWYVGDDSIYSLVDLIFSEDSEIIFHYGG